MGMASSGDLFNNNMDDVVEGVSDTQKSLDDVLGEAHQEGLTLQLDAQA